MLTKTNYKTNSCLSSINDARYLSPHTVFESEIDFFGRVILSFGDLDCTSDLFASAGTFAGSAFLLRDAGMKERAVWQF
jgi:hypothetical protein